jgi:hypothetical protein
VISILAISAAGLLYAGDLADLAVGLEDVADRVSEWLADDVRRMAVRDAVVLRGRPRAGDAVVLGEPRRARDAVLPGGLRMAVMMAAV